MKLDEFDFFLPAELIAQTPSGKRDDSRMMLINRKTGELNHHHFYELTDFLREGDTLVVNDSQVIPARLIGQKPAGGRVEVLLLHREEGDNLYSSTWQVLLKPTKGLKEGTEIFFSDKGKGRIIERVSEKKWRIILETELPVFEFLDQYGRVPLPPYIKRDQEEALDKTRYQTIYARVPGSVAAPTAGLHFSEQVLAGIRQAGVHIAAITLHVGYGTFSPVVVDEIDKHVVDEEYYEISPESAALINQAKRVIAVGTTSMRTLEAAADERGGIKPGANSTNLYIYPGHTFRRVDALITNFHLPRSSLFILVSAFAGGELMHRAYRHAIENRYRFYSYGDCSFII